MNVQILALGMSMLWRATWLDSGSVAKRSQHTRWAVCKTLVRTSKSWLLTWTASSRGMNSVVSKLIYLDALSAAK